MQLNPTQFHVQKIHYFPVKSQQPMKLRPYEFNLDYRAVDVVANRLAETRTGMVTPQMLSGVSSSFVQPSAVGSDSVVTQSWVNTHRYIFMMKVLYVDHASTPINCYLIGYTDHDGMSAQGRVDPRMRHYVNNIIETMSVIQATPLGQRHMEKLFKLYNTIYSTDSTEIYTQRPTDMYDVMAARNTANFVQNVDSYGTLINMSNAFTYNVISSANTNNITTNYLANILNGGIHANKSSDIMMSSMIDGNEYNSTMGSYFKEPSITDNMFISALSAASGSRVKLPHFDYSTVEMLDQSVDSRTQLFNLTRDYLSPQELRSPEVGEHWQGQDPVTVKAFSLIENCVALATKYAFVKLAFIASNMGDIIGTIDVNVMDFKSFMDVAEDDYTFIVNAFKAKFVTDIFLSETNCGSIPMYMECHVDLLGTSKVFLQYAGYPASWYTAPSYANSLYSSVVTASKNTMDHSADQIHGVVESLTNALTHTHTNQTW